MTPMMRQYLEIKENYPDAILFFRAGDFYEMFLDDAITASRELELVLTSRSKGEEAKKNPMCGVPYHAADTYIDRLVAKGYKVAICEQMEDPAQAKGIVKRDVVRVVTPGTIVDSKILDEKKNNYLCTIYAEKSSFGVAFSDLSTGEVYVTKVGSAQKLIDEIARYMPTEIIVNTSVFRDTKLKDEIKYRFNTIELAKIEVTRDFSDELIRYWFSVEKATELNLPDDFCSVNALGMTLNHFDETQKMKIGHIKEVRAYSEDEYMDIDIFTRRNLEITETMRNKSKKGSLLWVLDKTKTAMGGRMLRTFLEKPLVDCAKITKRLYAVSELYENTDIREELANLLEDIYDMERILGKIACKSVNPKDMLSLKQSLLKLPALHEIIKKFQAPLLKSFSDNFDTMDELADLLDRAIKEDDTPMVIKDGGIIKEGYNADVDEYRRLAEHGKDAVRDIEAREKERTGIKTLRTGYNRVFGYYIEVSQSFRDMVPENYIRKQTLTNGERFITEELKELEGKILGASEFLKNKEYDLFCEVREIVADHTEKIQRAAFVVAYLDVLCSLAEVARKNNYTMPTVDVSDKIEIKSGRHPVVECMLDDTVFVPNDSLLDCGDNRMIIITGPNMAGKSTYMRQVAVIVLMAQIGSFVPAESARIGVCDKIFTRVGASDDLSAGQSTFMVEMTEVAAILKNATKKSLLVLGEIGRGTSTYDGLSIAWAVSEYIADKKKIGAKTLFATHYHELTQLEDKLDGVKNYCIACKKRGDDVIFLRRIIKGGADDSYGIEVSALAGLPKAVIERAKEILASIDKKQASVDVLPVKEIEDDGQIDFSDIKNLEIVDLLRDLDVTTLTPIEALNKLYELVKIANEGN